jgi:peptide deformylase
MTNELKTTMATEALKIHEIVKYPDPVLAKMCEPVTVFDVALRTLVAEMFESMYVAQGIGLAGPQIAIPKRLTVIDVSFKKDPRGKQMEEEGCLSLPEIREKVARAAWVKVKAQNERGEWFEVEGEELLARAILHEIDHLNGVLFIDRISRLKRELALRKIRKMQRNGEW